MFSDMHKMTAMGFVIIMVGGILYFTTQLMEGIDFLSAFFAIAIFLPLILMVVLLIRPYWLGLMFAFVSFSFAMPVPLLDQLGLQKVFPMIVFGFVMADLALKRPEVPELCHRGAKLILWSGAIALLHILLERPASARLGGTGGLNEALQYLIGFFAFVAISVEASRPWNIRRNLYLMLAFFVFFYLRALVVALPAGRVGFHWFELSGWMLASFSLARISKMESDRGGRGLSILKIVAVGIILVLSVLSSHRRGILIAMVIIAVVSFMYGWWKKALLLALAGIVAGLCLIASNPSKMPPTVLRTASLVLPNVYSSEQSAMALSGEAGWESSFRVRMIQLAWEKIEKNPLFGKGFAFDRDEIYNAYLSTSINKEFMAEANLERLAIGGSYHNSLIAYTVYCGIPAGLLLLFGSILIVKRFFLALLKENDSDRRSFMTGLLSFFGAITFMALTNGSGKQFFIVCLCLATMNGMLYQSRKEAQ